MANTRRTYLVRRMEGQGWSAGQTQALIEIVHEWAEDTGLEISTNPAMVRDLCAGEWSNKLFDRMWVRKSGRQIGWKLIKLRRIVDQLGVLLDKSGVGFDKETGLVHVPSGWNVPNEPDESVYLRTVGLPDADKLGYIFNEKELALQPFNDHGVENNPIVIDD